MAFDFRIEDFEKELSQPLASDWQIRDWLALRSFAKPLIDGFITEWNDLISNPQTRELECLDFVRENAGLLLFKPPETTIVLSEVALGSDHVIDFVRVTEGFSEGTKYELIEFESPNSRMYNKNGKTSARLSGAIDQVLEWRRWIREHRSQAEKIFPSARWGCGAEPMFQYSIVIGRREESVTVRNKIWSRLHDGAISIKSYDRLADWAARRFFVDSFICGLAAQDHKYVNQRKLLNLAACPFFRAMKHAEWKKLNPTRYSPFCEHLTGPFLELVPHTELINQTRLRVFDELVAKQVSA